MLISGYSLVYRLHNRSTVRHWRIHKTMCKLLSTDSGTPSQDLDMPEEPKEEDCCRGGCQNCVFDVYAKALEQWKQSKQKAEARIRYDLLSITKFKPFVLTNAKKLTGDTYLYTFKPMLQNDAPISGFLAYNAGQYLSLRIDQEPEESSSTDKKSHFIRDFTITSLSDKKPDCSVDMLIKLYTGSLTSNYIGSWKIGDISYWRGPYGDFKHVPNSYSHLIMFCMGTGIAPFYPIICEIVENEKDETLIDLHFGCRDSTEIILRDELQSLGKFWNFYSTYYLPDEKDLSQQKYLEKFVIKRITPDDVIKAVTNRSNYFILVCGSSSFNESIKETLESIGIDKNKYCLF